MSKLSTQQLYKNYSDKHPNGFSIPHDEWINTIPEKDERGIVVFNFDGRELTCDFKNNCIIFSSIPDKSDCN